MRAALELLSRIQLRSAVPFVVIGGWALQAHGYTRSTVDVDCLVPVAALEDLESALNQAGFECFDRVSAFRRFRHTIEPLMVIDVMRVDQPTFDKVAAGAFPFTFGRVELRVPALPHLIALKLHSAKNVLRAGKDLADIAELLRANPDALNSSDLGAIVDQFGDDKARDSLKAWL